MLSYEGNGIVDGVGFGQGDSHEYNSNENKNNNDIAKKNEIKKSIITSMSIATTAKEDRFMKKSSIKYLFLICIYLKSGGPVSSGLPYPVFL